MRAECLDPTLIQRSAASRSNPPDLRRARQPRATPSRHRPRLTAGRSLGSGPGPGQHARCSPAGPARWTHPRVLRRRRVIESGFPTPTGRSQPRAEQEVARHPGKPAVAIVIDDLVSMSPWTPRGLEIRGSVRPERPLKPNVRAERRVGGLIRAGRITGRWPRVRNTSARRGGRKRLMPSVKPADRSPPNIRADVLDGARGFAPTNRRTGP